MTAQLHRRTRKLMIVVALVTPLVPRSFGSG
jgi:hypothetical protein